MKLINSRNLVLFGLASLLVAACSSSDSGSTFQSGNKPDASVGGSGGGSAGSAGKESDAAMLIETGGDDDAALTKDAACAAIEVQAERLPLDLYFMVDRSISMAGAPWTSQSNALKAFFSDAKSDGLWVALKFFPLDNKSTPQDSSCSGLAYAKPLINWGELPGSKDNFVGAVTSATANGSFTPTQEALQGVLKGAKDRQVGEPMHVVAAVIVSDGEPCCSGSCPVMDSAGLGKIAANYASGTPSIKTFSIFVAKAATDVMTAIAKGGGTSLAYDATAGQAAFTNALEKIRGAALSCEYKMPTVDGGVVDPNYLVVNYKPTPAETAQGVVRKLDSSACGSELGWYYDNNTAPQKIILCPQTCKTMQANATGAVEILVSCSSNPI